APVPLQLAYQAWVTNTRTVLRQQEQPEQPQTSSSESIAERSNILQRALNVLRFLWLLFQALVDGLTQWLDTCTREHTAISQVLRLERCVMAERLARGEDINEEFPNELYEREEEFSQELSPAGSVAADGCLRAAPSSSSLEHAASTWQGEDVAEDHQFFTVPPPRRRTASELLRSRWVWGQRSRD
ncbi:PIEZ1 protein, partial [Phainopepla nitens]|nr:PIEZ1 protein [Phainopepla nitens]